MTVTDLKQEDQKIHRYRSQEFMAYQQGTLEELETICGIRLSPALPLNYGAEKCLECFPDVTFGFTTSNSNSGSFHMVENTTTVRGWYNG